MKLTSDQLSHYENEGFVQIPNVFNEKEIKGMCLALDDLMVKKTEDMAFENDDKTIRALHGCHQKSEIFNRLTLQKRLLVPVTQLINTESVYLHQFKVNIKNGFSGDVWPWHQDFVYWHMEDGIPTPKNLTAFIFLDDVDEFNAPMYFIPKSHKHGSLNNLTKPKNDNSDWRINFGTTPKYIVSNDKIAELARKYGLYSAKGLAGSVIFFDSNLVHASSQNISPFSRKLIFLAYNCAENFAEPGQSKRPGFLASHKYDNILPLSMDLLLIPNIGGGL